MNYESQPLQFAEWDILVPIWNVDVNDDSFTKPLKP